MSDSGSWRIADLFRQFFDIALLRRGPEDLPASQSVLTGTVVAYVLASLAAGALLPPQPGDPVLLLAVDTGLMLLWLVLLLKVAKRPERFQQTATAVFGFQLVLAPLFAAGMWAFLGYREDANWQVPVSMLIVALGIWALVVNARILKSATEWPMFSCIALVLAQALLARGLLLVVFPQAATG